MKLGFSGQILKKVSNVKCYENLSGGSRVVPCGQTDGWTDRHDEANSRFSQFCECAKNEPLPCSNDLYCVLIIGTVL